MGFKDVDFAYTVKGLTAPQKAVLAAIAHATDDKTHVTVIGQQSLAECTSLSIETVRRAVGVLDRLGIIERHERHRANGARSSDEITLNTSYQADSPPVTQPTGHTARKAEGGEPTGQTEGGPRADRGGGTPPTEGGNGVTQFGHPVDHPSDQLIASEFFDHLEDLDEHDEYWIGRRFIDFWAAWPRSEGKAAASKAWLKAVTKAGDPKIIVDWAVAYANSPHRPPKQFIPHASTWLNGERWTDPLPEAPEPDWRSAPPTPAERMRATLALVTPIQQEIS